MKKMFFLMIGLFICENCLGKLRINEQINERMLELIPNARTDTMLRQSVEAVARRGDTSEFCNITQYVKETCSFFDENVENNAFNIIFSLDELVLSYCRKTDSLYNDAYTSMKSILDSLDNPNYKNQKDGLKYQDKCRKFSEFDEPLLSVPYYDFRGDAFGGAIALY